MVISCWTLCFVIVGIFSSNARVDAYISKPAFRLTPSALKNTKRCHLFIQANPILVDASSQLVAPPVHGTEQLSLLAVTKVPRIFTAFSLNAVTEVLSWQVAAYVLVIGALVAAVRAKLLVAFKSMILSRLAACLPTDLVRSVRRPFEIGIFAVTFALKYVSYFRIKKRSMVCFID